MTQQAVSQAERGDANPTVSCMRRWAKGCGLELEIRLEESNTPRPSAHTA